MNWPLVFSIGLCIYALLCTAVAFYYLRKSNRLMHSKEVKQNIRFDVQGRLDKKTEAQLLAKLFNNWPRGVK